ncbi:Na(+)-translocating NADH-quinone reductase subunit A [Candidatus Providencia siddallii]|uniref:Na(+)-translocating NADH-quinone reductase subunit A n=1 Tax=Candidatus Providencia siddallii TaxID=1715285 RepID=A0A0M6W8H1_9GAMM|nr:Na(+)-translocating NADH-quinone reductase subunit A [Candidatus Providencia siddallii]
MIKIKKGLNLPIAGEPIQKIEKKRQKIHHVALLGEEYIGMYPIMLVKVGDNVIKGQTIFEDKKNPGVLFTSPACGIIIAINRSENKILQSVVIKINGNKEKLFSSYKRDNLKTLTKNQVIENLINSGMWTSFRTRPFSRSPQISSSPIAIFVTAIDTNPLSANPAIIIYENEQSFNDGLIVLTHLTSGKIHVCYGIDKISKITNNDQIIYTQFIGPHPAGLVGTHIHLIKPVNIKKNVWTINYQDVIAIGKLFITGFLYTNKIISFAGPQVKKPRLLRTCIGANLYEITKGELKKGENRIISGSVLCGVACDDTHHYLGRFHNQISVLAEDREKKIFGWIKSGTNEFSITRTTIGHFLKKKRFNFTTAINGSNRPIIPIGNYEHVMPLDIMITNLLRELIVMDTEASQNLGCLELDEEDLGLCTYVCLSKHEYGSILRKVLTKIELEG